MIPASGPRRQAAAGNSQVGCSTRNQGFISEKALHAPAAVASSDGGASACPGEASCEDGSSRLRRRSGCVAAKARAIRSQKRNGPSGVFCFCWTCSRAINRKGHVSARQRLGLRWPSTAMGVSKAPAAVAPKRRCGAPRRRKGWRSPKPGGISQGSWKGSAPTKPNACQDGELLQDAHFAL